ncbi:MAG: sodium:proton antiporter [Rhodothermales bacterium]|nr:sodium:proton antiporter [Rhodothermales bacterium]
MFPNVGILRLAKLHSAITVLAVFLCSAGTAFAQEQAEPASESPVVVETAPDSVATTPVGAEAGDQAEAAIEHTEQDEHAEGDHDEHGPLPPVWLVIPFAILLLMIATGPLFYAHHWHHHYPKYSVGLGLIVAAYYIFGLHTIIPVLHAIQEYIAFIALVASLFIAASGIFLKINARGTPVTNVALLFIASVIANIIATTGAAMLFIRAYMRLNAGRLKQYHIVFFIFLVANVGGALTPIGDPPLFLGFLRGVPFFWTLAHVWFIWLPATAILLLIFFVIDSRNKDVAQPPAAESENEPVLKVQGLKNLIWIALIIVLVFVDPNVLPWVPTLDIGSVHLPFGIREVLMLTVAVLAYKTADPKLLEKNEFNFEPIREVGWLFLGIFATMQPALANIAAFAQNNADSLGVGVFYWGTGALSGILDNAPTYLNFVSAAMGKFGLDVADPAQVVEFASDMTAGGSGFYLQAISVAAVFFGAMTYIGNAPNFMCKAIAEANGVDTPSFMAYLVKYSLPILVPTYFLIYAIFFSGWIL